MNTMLFLCCHPDFYMKRCHFIGVGLGVSLSHVVVFHSLPNCENFVLLCLLFEKFSCLLAFFLLMWLEVCYLLLHFTNITIHRGFNVVLLLFIIIVYSNACPKFASSILWIRALISIWISRILLALVCLRVKFHY